MKTWFDFERVDPPVCTEALLRQRLEKKHLRRQVLALGLGGILLQLCILMTGILLYGASPILTTLFTGYVLVSIIGSIVLLFVFRKNRRFLRL